MDELDNEIDTATSVIADRENFASTGQPAHFNLSRKSKLTLCFFGQHYALFGMEQETHIAATKPHFQNSRFSP
jgi:hypothetical protein